MREHLFNKVIIPALLVVMALSIGLGLPAAFADDTCDSRFSWLPYDGSNSYRIYYGMTEGGPYPNYVDVGNPSPVDGRIYGEVTGLSCGKKYYFVCTSVSAQGEESEYSRQEIVITPPDSLTIVN